MNSAYQAWNAAFNSHDAKALAAIYAEDGTVLPPSHEVAKGRAAIEKFWDGMFKMGLHDHTLSLIEAMGDKEGVAAAAKWAVQGKGSDGKDATFSGTAMQVFVKKPDGGLTLVMHTFN